MSYPYYEKVYEDFDIEALSVDGSWGLINSASNAVDASKLLKMERERHPDTFIRINHVIH
jgi:hypothetical protein